MAHRAGRPILAPHSRIPSSAALLSLLLRAVLCAVTPGHYLFAWSGAAAAEEAAVAAAVAAAEAALAASPAAWPYVLPTQVSCCLPMRRLRHCLPALPCRLASLPACPPACLCLWVPQRRHLEQAAPR